MIDKNYCMSSYLALRYVEKENTDFFEGIKYKRPHLKDGEKVYVRTAFDIDKAIALQIEKLCGRKIGILLSGGMDSAILASYLKGCDAYTFRFLGGDFQREEMERAEKFAEHNEMSLHYVDIDWDIINASLPKIMKEKGGPVHSIEPQIYQGAIQAKADGIDLMIIGDGSDYVFGGMDQLLSKDWKFDEFIKRYIYIDPKEVLDSPISVDYLFERYRNGENIDFLKFMSIVATEESYGSYSNAFETAQLNYYDPYEILEMAEPLDLERIRKGESKYLIRELFKIRYPDFNIPEKIPMPRPVDKYFENWGGPRRKEFKSNLNMNNFTGNQKWLLYCLERFLNIYD